MHRFLVSDVSTFNSLPIECRDWVSNPSCNWQLDIGISRINE
jgi:hypothetical protein